MATPTHRVTTDRFLEELARRAKMVLLNPADLFADLVAMEDSFPDPKDHQMAMAEIVDQIDIIGKRMPGKNMKGNLLGWRRHAFQSDPRSRKLNAGPRIVYRVTPQATIEVFGFGHRHMPLDFYLRLKQRPRPQRDR